MRMKTEIIKAPKRARCERSAVSRTFYQVIGDITYYKRSETREVTKHFSYLTGQNGTSINEVMKRVKKDLLPDEVVLELSIIRIEEKRYYLPEEDFLKVSVLAGTEERKKKA